MADIIAELAARAGVSPEMAGKGIGAILNLLKDKLPAGLFTQVQAALPNANGLMADAAQAQETSGGLMGAVSGAVGKLFGGGGAAEAVNKLGHLGFSADQIQKFLPSVMEFFKNKLPPDVLKQVSGFLPTGEAGG
jgi:hypothetical protein